MNENGFIKVNRSIMDWEWYKEPNILRVFLHCLLRAVYKPTKYKGKNLDRGEFFTTTKNWQRS